MLPLVLNPLSLKAGLAGSGEALARRAALLAEAGVEARLLSPDASDEVLAPLQLLFVAGLGEGEARDLAGRARAFGTSGQCRRCSAALRLPCPGHGAARAIFF